MIFTKCTEVKNTSKFCRIQKLSLPMLITAASQVEKGWFALKLGQSQVSIKRTYKRRLIFLILQKYFFHLYSSKFM